uniref:Glycosyl transferase CAP10 domain-containing protein n=1 Tax=Helicotheca tamesis TaxID=374047 RepID=A0A7S2MYU0_9STRA|eukprot:CAMPEP_0185730632 /NCGR_PEP_ID=MMETSP1171-20130828/10529_1 /TAXON_ID=374046 /ORGANISM="Helicotheca tamensis, Strain CCMP826" /LENGTH=513 /DNA_ID=CAMNT_0028399725 /DNA_START=55 /DNA_END=1596 /DNA_ORIENTATION=-
MAMPRQMQLKIAFCVLALYISSMLIFEKGIEGTSRSLRSIFKIRRDLIDGGGGLITHTPPSWQKGTVPYTHEDVLRTQKVFGLPEYNVLMVFDGESGVFRTYGQRKDWNRNRASSVNFMIAQSLLANFPERFHRGAPTCQILYNTNDYPTTDVRLLDFSSLPDDVGYAPVLQFGSVPREEALLHPIPIKEMPFVRIMGCVIERPFPQINSWYCFFNEDTLSSLLNEPNTRSWEDMKSQIFWRGADYNFLNRLGDKTAGGANFPIAYDDEKSVYKSLMAVWDKLAPRWKAVTLSLSAAMEAHQDNSETLPWIDAKFFNKNPLMKQRLVPFVDAGAEIATDQFVTHEEQKDYKYHFDLGGGGGTSWTGTLSKLAMPGVLFHHETITRDWFYDEMQPWVHYIPVKMDLSDLREKFEWAEAHPAECKAMSDAASDFVRKMDSQEFMMEVYVKYLVERLGEVADAYRPGSETLESIIEDYEANGIQLEEYSTCDAQECFFPWKRGIGQAFQGVEVEES